MFLETDQIACYDMDGRLIACRDTGQDASFKQPHKAVYADRFSVQEDRVMRGFFTSRMVPSASDSRPRPIFMGSIPDNLCSE